MNNVGTKSEVEFSYFIFLDRHLISWDSSSISWRRVFSALQAIGVEPAIKQLHTLYVSPFMKNIFLSGWEGVIHQINSESEQNPKRHIIFSNLNQLHIYLCLTSLSIASSCNKKTRLAQQQWRCCQRQWRWPLLQNQRELKHAKREIRCLGQ